MARITQQSSIHTTGTSYENEPVIKSDAASSDVMEWAASTGTSTVEIAEDASNNLKLKVDGVPVVAGASGSDGQGLHFNGAGNIDIATPPDLGTKFSFEFILQADSIAASGYNYIADFGNGGGRFAIASIDGVLGIFDTNERLFAGVTFLDDLKAHHLVVTVDGTAAIAYDNGNQVGTATLGATSNIDSATDAKIGSRFDGTPFFNGTIYRCRFWNKTLSSTEVTDAYENATVNFADQWVGAATNMITGAVDKNWGTAQADSGNDATDRATFNTNYTWNTDGNITDISVASNVLQFTSASSGTSGLWYPTGTIVAGKRYRIIIRTGAITGGDFKVRVSTGSYVDLATLTASSTNVIDFVAPKSVLNYIYINSSDAGATIQLNAASVSNELFRAGVVADYDLAFAQPEISLTIQDRSTNGVDGTASATGVTQVTPIEQLNANKLSVGGTVPRVGIGLAAGTAPSEVVEVIDPADHTYLLLNTSAADKDAAIRCSDQGTAKWEFGKKRTTNNFGIYNYAGGEWAFEIDSAGTVKIPRADDSAAHLSLSQSEGSGKTYNILADDAGAFVIRDGVTGRLTISSAGSVSTSTTAQEMLSVNSTNATGGYLTWKNSSASVLYVGNRNAISGGQATYGVGSDIWATTGRGLSFHTNSTSTPRINISSAGLTTVTNPGWPLKNELTNSGFDVWSNSTLEDVGSDLVTNGGFDSAATGWTPDNATLASVAGGQSGNCLEVTRTGSDNQKATQAVTVVAGKLYKITAYVKSGSSGNEAFKLQLLDGSTVTGTTSGTSSGSWVQYSVVAEALTTSMTVQLIKDTATVGTMLFDTVTYKEVTPGCVAADNLGPDGWAKDATLDIWRQHNDGGTNTKDGSFYSLKTTTGAASDFLYWPGSTYNNAEHTQRFAGRTLTVGCWCKTSTASHCRIRLYDGTSGSSDYHTGGGDWEWLEGTLTVSATATTFYMQIDFAVSGADAYISQPMLVFGSAIGEGNYTRPQGEVINLEKFVEIQTNVSPAAADDKILNLEALSNGKIPKGAKAIHSFVEVLNSSIASGQGIRYGPTSTYPYQLACFPQVNNIYLQSSGRINCDANGDIYQQVTETGATLSGLYHNINTVVLR